MKRKKHTVEATLASIQLLEKNRMKKTIPTLWQTVGQLLEVDLSPDQQEGVIC